MRGDGHDKAKGRFSQFYERAYSNNKRVTIASRHLSWPSIMHGLLNDTFNVSQWINEPERCASHSLRCRPGIRLEGLKRTKRVCQLPVSKTSLERELYEEATWGDRYFSRLSQQYRQYTNNVILRRVQKKLLLWIRNKYYTLLCASVGARQQACGCAYVSLLIQHAIRRHFVICGLSESTTLFRHYLINGTIFGEKVLNIKCMFWFSLQYLFETFLILSGVQRDIVINVKTSSCKVPGILVRF
jgi:hypothetical protein